MASSEKKIIIVTKILCLILRYFKISLHMGNLTVVEHLTAYGQFETGEIFMFHGIGERTQALSQTN